MRSIIAHVDDFAKSVKAERERRGMTHDQLAQLAKVSKKTLLNFEKYGLHSPNLVTALAVCSILELTLFVEDSRGDGGST